MAADPTKISHQFPDRHSWQVFDVVEDGNILASSDAQGSLQLVEILSGRPTPRTSPSTRPGTPIPDRSI